MDIQTIGVIVTAVSALLGANAFLMKLVIESSITKALLSIERDFVTKEEFNRHIDNCPAKRS